MPEHQVLSSLHYTAGDVSTGGNAGPLPEDSHQPTHTPPHPFQLIDLRKKKCPSAVQMGPGELFQTRFAEEKKVPPYSHFEGKNQEKPQPVSAAALQTKAVLFTVSSPPQLKKGETLDGSFNGADTQKKDVYCSQVLERLKPV